MTDRTKSGVSGKPVSDGYRCELCGEWIEYRNISKVLPTRARSRMRKRMRLNS
jgi:hypothetical protein